MKVMKEFMKEKAPLLRRLEYIRLLVLDPAACVDGSLRKRKSLDYPSNIYTRYDDHSHRNPYRSISSISIYRWEYVLNNYLPVHYK